MTADVLTEAYFQDPSRAYAALTAAGAARLAGRVWVAGHELCRDALADRRLSSNRSPDGGALTGNLLLMDGAPHARLRRAVTSAIARGPDRHAVERLAAEAWERCTARLRGGARVDFLADVAQPVTCQLIGTYLGFDPDGAAALLPSLRAVAAFFEEFEAPADRAAGEIASGELLGVVDERFEELARRSGFAAALSGAVDAGEISRFEAVSSTIVCLSGGFENPSNFLAGVALEHLSGRFAPGELDRLGLEERFRRISPAQVLVRVARAPLTIGGVDVAEGETVLVVLAAANTEPGAAGTRHLAFGHGAHACVAAGLSRIGLRPLAERVGPLLDGAELERPPRWRTRMELRAMEALHVTLRGSP